MKMGISDFNSITRTGNCMDYLLGGMKTEVFGVNVITIMASDYG
jgi:hypothetical protein